MEREERGILSAGSIYGVWPDYHYNRSSGSIEIWKFVDLLSEFRYYRLLSYVNILICSANKGDLE